METDRGWAWIVMGAVMASSFLETGTFKTFGIFFVAFLEKYDASATATSLVSAVYSVAYSVFAFPVMTCAIERFSGRQLVTFGGFCLFLSYLLCSFATSIEFIIFAQGVVSALASACIHGPSVVVLNRYFEKRRSFAVGMAISFGSIGGIIFPIFFTKLMQEYYLNGALLIQSSILLNAVVAGALLRPMWLTQKFTEYKIWNQQKNEKNKEDITNVSKVSSSSWEMLKEQKGFLNENEDFSKEECEIKLHFKEQAGNMLNTSTLSGISHFSSSRDIFSASMAELRQIEIKTENVIVEKQECLCNGVYLSKYVDLNVCKMKLVILFATVFSFGSVACILTITFIPPFARQRGMSDTDVAIFAATLGGCEFVGRICCGILADLNIVQRYKIVMFGLFVVGTIVQFLRFLTIFWHFEVFCVVFGFFGGFLVSLYSPVCVDFIGLDNFHKAVGILFALQGTLLGISGIIIGVLRDISGDYVIGFHFTGACGLLATFLFYFVPYLKEEEEEEDDEVVKQTNKQI